MDAALHLPAAWDCARRFIQTGDIAANTTLYGMLRQPLLDAAGPATGFDATSTIAPLMLQHALAGDAVRSEPSVLLLVTILNRIYCLKVLPESLAQPLDRRPVGMNELLDFYWQALAVGLPRPAEQQLLLCVASVLVLTTEDVVSDMRKVLGVPRDGEVPEHLGHSFLKLFIAVTDIVADRRVPIGPLRRAHQRRVLQQQLHIILFQLHDPETLLLQVRALLHGVSFLMEGIVEGPQEASPLLWQKLPTSSVWHWCLSQVRELGDKGCPQVILDAVCSVLQCLTTLDREAERLLASALDVALADVEKVGWCASCRIISAALESATEEVVLTLGPGSTLFAQFSSAAERLVHILRSPDLPEDVVLLVCEGMSVLTQVLQPAIIPPMESTDDLDDYRDLVENMMDGNSKKEGATRALRDFLVACQSAVFAQLAALLDQDAVRCIAAYALQHPDIYDDFHVTFDEVALALFAAYERLCRLLQSLPPDVAQLPLHQVPLVGVMWESGTVLEHLARADAAPEVAALLPVVTARYSKPIGSRDAVWSRFERGEALEHCMRWLEASVRLRSLSAARSSMDALWDVLLPWLETPETAGKAKGMLPGVGAALWSCIVMPGSCNDLWSIAAHLGMLIEREWALLPPEYLEPIAHLDCRTRLELLSCSAMEDIESLHYVLPAVSEMCASGELESDATLLLRVGRRLNQKATQRCASGQWDLTAYTDILEGWFRHHPLCTPLYLQVTKALPFPQRAVMQSNALEKRFSHTDSQSASVSELALLLDAEVCECVASWPPAAAMLMQLVCWLAEPASLFMSLTDGCARLHLLARCGRLLLAGGHCAAGDLQKLFLTLKQRYHDCLSSHVVASSSERTPSERDTTGDDEMPPVAFTLLEELAILSHSVHQWPGQPDAAPVWFMKLLSASDDHERLGILRGEVCV